MKKVLFILFIVFSPVIYAQEKTNISLLELQNSSIESAILNIENKTDFKFYFDKKWLRDRTPYQKLRRLSSTHQFDPLFITSSPTLYSKNYLSQND